MLLLYILHKQIIFTFPFNHLRLSGGGDFRAPLYLGLVFRRGVRGTESQLKMGDDPIIIIGPIYGQ
jgi:hypothetical protein